tara:strand:+ start:1078 stop:2508 length:1431 start_codon:yes stop_codon:yes gene_type:complete
MKTFKRFTSELNETALNGKELSKYQWRIDLFLTKMKKGEKFELIDGSTVQVKNDEETRDIIASGTFPKGFKVTTTDGTEIALSQFQKNAEFGGSAGAGGKLKGADWEQVICCAFNMASKKVDPEEAKSLAGMDKWKSKYDAHLETGAKIVLNTFGKKPSGIMEHYGAGSSDLSQGWDKYFIKMTGKSASASTKTPKTDMYIGKEHISLKKAGGSQLMSGGVGETLATLGFAYDNIPSKTKTKEFDKAWKKLSKKIEKEYVSVNLPKGATIGSLKGKIKKGKKSGILDTVKKAIQDNNEMTDAIRTILEAPDAKKQVVHEAMTGRSKFAEKLPKANYFMIFDEGGGGSYIKINNSLVNKYTSKTEFNISFKASGAGGSAWTALKGIFKEENELYDDPLDKMIDESFHEAECELLSEGFMDRVKGGVAKFKQSTLIKFISIGLKKLWNKIKEWVAKGIEFILGLLGKQMIATSPTINF